MRENLYIAKNIEDALRQRLENPKESKFLAGGTNIFRLNSNPFKTLVSLQDLKLNTIKKSKDGIKIGAMTTLQEIVDNSLVPDYFKEACRLCKSKTLRNMATVGGNLNSNIDTSYLVPTLYASKVRVEIAELDSENKVNIENLPIREYLENQSRFKGNLILSIIIPKDKRVVVTKTYRRSSQAPSVVTVSCGFSKNSSFRIGYSSSSTVCQRLEQVEKKLDEKSYKTIDDLYKDIKKQVKVKEDYLGSKNYKKHLIAITVCNLLEKEGVL